MTQKEAKKMGNEVGHTKGPWSNIDNDGWNVDHDDANYVAWGAIGVEGRAPICLVFTQRHHTDPEYLANGQLICSAPEMLSQLDSSIVDLELLLRAIGEGDPKAELELRVKDIIRHNRAAISRATGAS